MPATRKSKEKLAIITGAGSGIGRATALALTEDGYILFLIGRKPEKLRQTKKLVERAGGKAEVLAIDLRQKEAGGRLVAAALAWVGRIDSVVNCAGTFPSAPFADMTDEDWDDALNINLTAAMRLSRAAVKPLQAQGGSIVNVSSINAVIGDDVSKCAHYTAAKAGMLGLTRQMAAELAPRIRVNAVVPGAVDTPMLEGWLEDPAERQRWLERFVPMKRIAQPEDVAAAIAFLVSDAADYITGAAIPVDGGMSIV